LEIEAEDEDLVVTIEQAGKDVAKAVVISKKTKQSFVLTAADGKIIAWDPRDDRVLKTTEFTLERGGKKSFSAPVLLEDRAVVLGRADTQFLQGSWVAVSAEENRAPLAADDLRKIRLTFDGEQLRLQTHMMGAGDLTGLYVLSPAKSPKEILLV